MFLIGQILERLGNIFMINCSLYNHAFHYATRKKETPCILKLLVMYDKCGTRVLHYKVLTSGFYFV